MFSATRHLPPTYVSNVPLSVTLNIHFEPGDCGAAVVDYVPLGWRVSNIWGPGAGLWNTNSGRIVWAPIDGPLCGGSADAVLGYDLTPAADASGSYSITGIISVDGSSVPSVGDSTLYPLPLILGITRSDTDSVLQFTSCANVLYSVQRSPTIVPPQWITIGTNLHGTGEIMQAIDADPGGASNMFYRIVVQATAATRLCPARYTTNRPTTVKITLTLTPEVCQATVVESPPLGWQITDVSSGGNATGPQIVWALPGPACGGSNLYNLTYSATAPLQETNTCFFAGQFTVSGVTNQILGNTQVLPPLADVPNLATRTLPAYYTPCSNLTVTVAISLAPNACGAAVTEMPPAGWLVSNVQGAWLSPSRIIMCTPSGPLCGGVSTYQFTYTVTPPASTTGTAIFTGQLSVDGSSWLTAGDSQLPIGP